MNLDEAKFKFEERLYRWALQDWKREIDEDFPLLGSLKDALAQRCLRIMRSLDEENRRLMATALAKRARKPEVLAKCFDPITKDDKRLEQLFMHKLEVEGWREAGKISPDEFRLVH